MFAILISFLSLIAGLQPPATISGRVTLRGTGAALEGIDVTLLEKHFNADGVEVIEPVTTVPTGRDGKYQFPISTPGRYLVGTEGTGTDSNLYIPELRTLDEELEPPRSVTVDFEIERGNPVAIHGHFVDGTGHRYQHWDEVWLRGTSFGSTLTGWILNRQHYVNSGTFEFKGVAPGFYRLGGYRMDDVTNRTESILPIAVRDKDLNVDLVSEAAFILGGRIRFAGTRTTLYKVRISVLPVHPQPDEERGASASVRPDGFFALPAVAGGLYRLSVGGLAPPLYVKSARMDGADAFVKGIRLPGADKAAQSVEILLGEDGGEIHGNVVDGNGGGSSECTVVLIPEAHGLLRTDLYKRVEADSAGQFRIAGIAPGAYRIYAWRNLNGYEYFDPEFIKRFESAGARAQVAAGGRLNLELRLLNAHRS